MRVVAGEDVNQQPPEQRQPKAFKSEHSTDYQHRRHGKDKSKGPPLFRSAGIACVKSQKKNDRSHHAYFSPEVKPPKKNACRGNQSEWREQKRHILQKTEERRNYIAPRKEEARIAIGRRKW